MLGQPPGQSGLGRVIAGALHVLANLMDRVSRLVDAVGEVIFEPAILFVFVIPTLAVAVIAGSVVALVTWSAWTFVVVVVAGSALGVPAALVVPTALWSAIDWARERAGRRPLSETNGDLAFYTMLAAGPAVALVVAFVVALAW